jgi:hypothetical protein
LEEHLKLKWGIFLTVAAAAAVISACSIFADATDDRIIGTWQQSTVNGSTPLLVNVLKVSSDDTYSLSAAGVTTTSGTWSKNGKSYTFSGTIFGFLNTGSVIVPTFSNSDRTLSYTDSSGYVEVYKK